MASQHLRFRYDEGDAESPGPHAGATGGRVWAALMRMDSRAESAARPCDQGASGGLLPSPPAGLGAVRGERYELFERLALSLEGRLLRQPPAG